MITVSLLEPNWKELFESELAKIGLKKCDPVRASTKYFTYKHGSRRFVLDEFFQYSDNRKFHAMFSYSASEISFDDVAFKNYIDGLIEKGRKKHSFENVIKFNQEFFQIRLSGLLEQLHSSLCNVTFVECQDSCRLFICKFNIYSFNFTLRHESSKSLSELSDADYLEECWTLFCSDILSSYGTKLYNKIRIATQLKNILEILSCEDLKKFCEHKVSEINNKKQLIKNNETLILFNTTENENLNEDISDFEEELLSEILDSGPKKYSEEQLRKIDSKKLLIAENSRSISWMNAENVKYKKDISVSEELIIDKMKELYETFRHRPSENKLGKSLTTGEEGIPKT